MVVYIIHVVNFAFYVWYFGPPRDLYLRYWYYDDMEITIWNAYKHAIRRRMRRKMVVVYIRGDGTGTWRVLVVLIRHFADFFSGCLQGENTRKSVFLFTNECHDNNSQLLY